MTEEQIDPKIANAPITEDSAVVDMSAKARDWKGLIVLALAIAAPVWGFFAAVGSGWGLWDWRSGFTGLTWSFYLSVLMVLLAGFFIWRMRKANGAGSRLLRWGALIVAAAYMLWIVSLVIGARGVPAIHDISTDLADPPAFQTLKLREDNWDNIPGADDEDMKGLSPQQRWRALHQDAYSDVRTVRINQPVAQVMAKAERLAKDRGWKIASYIPEQGRLEATDTTALFRFKDDVVLRVRPTENGRESIIDMRSVSRVGISDVGVNAKRINAFLADLAGTVTTGQ